MVVVGFINNRGFIGVGQSLHKNRLLVKVVFGGVENGQQHFVPHFDFVLIDRLRVNKLAFDLREFLVVKKHYLLLIVQNLKLVLLGLSVHQHDSPDERLVCVVFYFLLLLVEIHIVRNHFLVFLHK